MKSKSTISYQFIPAIDLLSLFPPTQENYPKLQSIIPQSLCTIYL